MQVNEAKVTSAIWGPLDKTVITGHDDGTVTQWDITVSGLRCYFLDWFYNSRVEYFVEFIYSVRGAFNIFRYRECGKFYNCILIS